MALSGRLHLETGSQKLKMAAAKTGCTYSSTSIQDSKEIPTATPVFSGSGTQWLCRIGSMSERKRHI
jgi:hypothetical protein